MKNIGGSYGGALTAGLFLQEFVDGAPWVHLDIAGPRGERRRRLPHQGRHRLRRAHAGRAGPQLRGADRQRTRGEGEPRPTVEAHDAASAGRAPWRSRGVATLAVASRVAPAVHRTVTVHIRDNLFSPASVDVEPGTTVRWVNDGRNTHNVTPSTGEASAAGT